MKCPECGTDQAASLFRNSHGQLARACITCRRSEPTQRGTPGTVCFNPGLLDGSSAPHDR
jgi:hypothetical protein